MGVVPADPDRGPGGPVEGPLRRPKGMMADQTPNFGLRFLGAALFLVTLVLLGVLGYVQIEGAEVADALYMSVITITAVGYEEVFPLSQAGRTFTMALLLGGISWMGIWFAFITSFIVELDLQHVFRERRVMRSIEKTSDHVVICGAGRTGRQVAEELTSMGQEYVIIERDPQRIERFYGMNPDAMIVQGDATVDHNLEDAGVERAKGLITCLSADTDNLFVCLSAKDMNSDLVVVARAYEEETMSKMYRAGADHVVSPNVSSAIRMASVMLRPSVLSFLDVATRSADFTLRIEQATISESSALAGKTLREAEIPQKTGLIVIAVRKGEDGDRFVFNPKGATRIEPGDDVIVLGTPDQIDDLKKYVKKS